MNQYHQTHNIHPEEFYRGLCWMEDVVCHILEKQGHCETTEQQLLSYLEDELQQTVELLQERDREIHRLKQMNKDLRKLTKKDRRELKKDINISVLCRDNRKLIKERDLYLSRLNSTREGDSHQSCSNK